MVARDTRWPVGTPCWVDASVDDVPKAIAFYQALFGWDIQAGGPEVGGYAIAHLHDRIVAGLGPKFGPLRTLRRPGRPTWPPTTPTRSRRRSRRRAARWCRDRWMSWRKAGWRIAFDPTGAAFGLWQGGRTTGIGLANETGALTWNEHVSWDFDAGKAFYRAVFGYDYQDVSGEASGTPCSWSTRVRSAASASTCRDACRDPVRLERLLRRRRHRRRGGSCRRARRQHRPAHQGQPVRPDRRRRRRPGRRLLADQQPSPAS